MVPPEPSGPDRNATTFTPGAQGLVLKLDSQGTEQSRWTPTCDRALLLKAASLDAEGQLWVAGELVEDYETDVFWGRPVP